MQALENVSLVPVGNIPTRNALSYPNKDALVFGGTRYTWKQLNKEICSLANGLLEQGVQPGSHVAILSGNSHQWVIAFFAVTKIGGVTVLVHNQLKGEALAQQLNHADVSCILVGGGFSKIVEEILPMLPKVKTLISWDRKLENGESIFLPYDELVSDGNSTEPNIPVADNQVASIVFSSGTTGMPKGAVNTHWNSFSKTFSQIVSQELSHPDVGIIAGPLFMGGVLYMSLLPFMMLGMKTVILPAFDTSQFMKTVEQEKVTTAFCVPTMINALVNSPDRLQYDLRSMKRFAVAGAPLPLELYRKTVAELNVNIYEIYGTSEGAIGTVLTTTDRERKLNSVGKPMVGARMKVVDNEGNELPPGEIGEILIGGDAMVKEYYNQPEITDYSFEKGWFHTGDLGKMDDEGYFYLIDRKKDMIITGGTNVYPKDVEEVFYQHPGVLEAAVIGLPHEKWGEAVTAVVSLKSGRQVSETDLLAYCKEHLASYQVPKTIIFVDEIPKTIFGKISKVHLREQYQSYYRENSVI